MLTRGKAASSLRFVATNSTWSLHDKNLEAGQDNFNFSGSMASKRKLQSNFRSCGQMSMVPFNLNPIPYAPETLSQSSARARDCLCIRCQKTALGKSPLTAGEEPGRSTEAAIYFGCITAILRLYNKGSLLRVTPLSTREP